MEGKVLASSCRLKEGKELRAGPNICGLCEEDVAVFYCRTCYKNLCNDCNFSHKKQKDTRNHEITNLDNATNRPMCLAHTDAEIKYYCDTCTSICCPHCVEEEHRPHKYYEIDQCNQQIKNLCQDMAKDLRIPFDGITKKEETIKQLKIQCVTQYADAKTEVTKRQTQLSKLITDTAKATTDMILKDEQDKVHMFTGSEAKLKELKSKCEHVLAPIMSVVLGKDVSKIIRSIQSIQLNTEEAKVVMESLKYLEKKEMVQTSDAGDWLSIISESTEEYLKVRHSSQKTTSDQNELIAKWMKPLLKPFEDEALKYKEDLYNMKTENTAIRASLGDEKKNRRLFKEKKLEEARKYKQDLDNIKSENAALRASLDDEKKNSAYLRKGMMLSKNQHTLDTNYVIAVAIELGTYGTSYAFSSITNKGEIKMNKTWGAKFGFETCKATSTVLTDCHGKFKAFGYDAEIMYANSVEEDPTKQLQLFNRFLLDLDQNKDTTVSRGGQITPIISIVAMALRYLKNHLLEALEQQGRKLDLRLIRWFLTVTEGCDETVMELVRTAAKQAGIIGDERSNKLMIVLAPDAAAMYCLSIPLHDFRDQSSKGDTGVHLPNGTKFMVIDCGTRTNVTSFEKKDGHHVRLLNISSVPHGGTQVDENFLKVLEDVLGSKFVKKYRTESPTQCLTMMVDFEKKKRSVDPSDPGRSINIQLAWALGSMYAAECGKPIDKAIRDARHKGVTFCNGMICHGKECLDEIFLPVVNDIVGEVETLLRKPALKDISHLFLVGGFSDSAYLQDAFKRQLGERKLLIPNSAGHAVLNGAVIMGHTPPAIIN